MKMHISMALDEGETEGTITVKLPEGGSVTLTPEIGATVINWPGESAVNLDLIHLPPGG